MTRPGGQLYLPDAAVKLANRYSFARVPSLDKLSEPTQTFGMGKFMNAQIEDLSIYNDGIIINSRSDTDLLDAFLSDLLAWSDAELGLVQSIIAKPEKHYESSLIIKSEIDLPAVIKPALAVVDLFNKTWKNKFHVKYRLTSFHLDCDKFEISSDRRKPYPFIVERRVGFPFEENVFYSAAPLPTKDHLDLLVRLEELARVA
ncbi:MAG: hypothetical protein WDN46_10160 [Methylocella sp.]